MTTEKRQLHLGAFLQGVGHHLAAWRHPDIDPSHAFNLNHFKNLARLAESAKFDAIFFADNLGLPSAPASLLAKAAPAHPFDPLLLLSALTSVTERIGLVGTVSTTYLPPYHLARKFASLDHFSNGRSGWNLVTSGTDFEAKNFGLDQQISHASRYARAAEYVDVVKHLWDSWEDESVAYNQSSAQFLKPHTLHRVDHQGQHFKVEGALQAPRPVQGYPVFVQAGSSDDGQDLAAATAEVVFTAQQTVEDARAFYQSLKARVAKFGRNPDAVKVLPGISPYVGKTDAEAQEKFEQLQSLIDPEVGLGLLSGFIGGSVDFSKYPLDGPLPELPATEGWQSRQELFVKLAKRDNLSIRQLYQRIAAARGHATVIGTPQSIADQLEHWFSTEAADGFNILAPTLPYGLEDFAQLVIPELQKRGLFRTQYTGRTLREHLGLARPEHPHLNF